MRVTAWSIASATHTLPAPVATPIAPRPTGITPTTRFVAGSILTTRSPSSSVTQTAPLPAATPPGGKPRLIVASIR